LSRIKQPKKGVRYKVYERVDGKLYFLRETHAVSKAKARTNVAYDTSRVKRRGRVNELVAIEVRSERLPKQLSLVLNH